MKLVRPALQLVNVFVAWVVLALLVPMTTRCETTTDARLSEVLQCLRRNLPKQSSLNDAVLVSTDRIGGKREFKARLMAKRMPDGFRRAKICVTAPPELRGSQVLALENDGGLPATFLYTEAVLTPKRITGGGLGAGIFGTDFTFDDFDRLMNLNRTEETKRLPDETREGRPTFLLEATPRDPSRGYYTKVKTWIDVETCVAVEAEFYGGQEHPRRVLTADLDRIVTKDGLSYPGRVTMRDLTEGTQTVLEITSSEIDGKLVTDAELEVGELGRYCR